MHIHRKAASVLPQGEEAEWIEETGFDRVAVGLVGGDGDLLVEDDVGGFLALAGGGPKRQDVRVAMITAYEAYRAWAMEHRVWPTKALITRPRS